MGFRDYTAEEKEALDKCASAFGAESDETDRLSDISDALTNYGCENEEELKKQFGPGSHGHSQAFDRIFVQAQIWDEFICESPSILLDKETHELAGIIGVLMGNLYQKVACQEGPEESEATDKKAGKPYLSETVEKMVEELKSSHSKVGEMYEDLATRVASECKKIVAIFEKAKKE